MGFSGSNLVTKHFIFKFVELVFIFIVFMIFRCGSSGAIFFWGKGTGENFITNPPPPTTTTKLTTTTTSTSTTTTTTTTTTSTTTTTTTQSGGRLAKVLGIGSLEDLEIKLPEQEFDPYASSGAYNLPEQAENDLVFGIMTSVGYLFITICIMIGIIMGDFSGDDAPRFTVKIKYLGLEI